MRRQIAEMDRGHNAERQRAKRGKIQGERERGAERGSQRKAPCGRFMAYGNAYSAVHGRECVCSSVKIRVYSGVMRLLMYGALATSV